MEDKEFKVLIKGLFAILICIVGLVFILSIHMKKTVVIETDISILELRVKALERDIEQLLVIEESNNKEEEIIKPMSIVEEILVFEPEEVEEEVIFEEPLRYEFTDDDIYIMARLLCGSKDVDGDGEYDFDYGNDERYDQISTVLGVVMNRVMDHRFPNTIKEVILQKTGNTYQFSPVARWSSSNTEISDIARLRVTEWCDAYNKNQASSIPDDHLYFSSNGKGANISRKNYK